MTSSERRRPRVVVIGAGVTGLSTAYALSRGSSDVEVTVLEASSRAGGNIRTEHIDGFVIDTGPDSFIRTKPEGLELCRELGLESQLVTTEAAARKVYVAHHGKLEPLPGGMALAIPTQLGPLMSTPLLSLPGKLRLLREPLMPRGEAGRDESIYDFFLRRVGEEATRTLVAPLLGGIHAGDIRLLSMRSTFPQLVALEEQHGSLLKGLLAAELSQGGQRAASPGLREVARWLRRRNPAEASSPFHSFRLGMGVLIDALVKALPEGALWLSSKVASIARGGHGLTVRMDSGLSLPADAVVLACPVHVAARLVGDEGIEAELSEVRSVTTATVFFALDRAQVAHDLRGFGFLVPEGEAEILAATWVSSKWAGRAPEGRALVRAFLGGARDEERVEASSDEELVGIAARELARFMGALGKPLFTRVYRYDAASPQPEIGHAARIARVRERLGKHPGIYVAGAAMDGVGIPDCIRGGRAAAKWAANEVLGTERLAT